MNKMMAFVFLALEVMLLFSACSAAFPEESSSEAEEEETKTAVFADENGKYGIKSEEGEILLSGTFDALYYETSFGKTEVFIGELTEGTRKMRFFDEKNRPYINEIPNKLFYFIGADGKELLPLPADDYVMHENGHGEKEVITFTFEGNRYTYEYTEEGFALLEKAENQKQNVGNMRKFCYYWGVDMNHGWGYGDIQKNLVFDMVYQQIEAPFQNRIVLYEGISNQSGTEVRAIIADSKGNILCENEYNEVVFEDFKNGYYIGVGICYGEMASTKIFDEYGKVKEAGYWFIDKDGKKISERFEFIDTSGFIGGKTIYMEEEIKVRSENGEEKTVRAIDQVAVELPVFRGENGKIGLKNPEGKIVVEAKYDMFEVYPNFVVLKTIAKDGTEKLSVFGRDGRKIGFEYNEIEPAGDWEKQFFSYRGKLTEGTMFGIEYDEKGEPSAAQVPMERYYLLAENGEPIIDIPFENYTDYSMEETDYICGVYNGSRYEYAKEGGKFVLKEKIEPEKRECECGFTHTSYCISFYGGYFKHGLERNGKVFLEPIHSGISVPFDDRVIIWYGSYMQGWDCGRCRIIDLEKNVLCEKFNRVQYYKLSDHTYVGLGIACGPNAEDPVFDENGDPMPEGIWFIDKDGNILSEKLDFPYDENHNTDIPEMKSPYDVITAINEKGEEIKLTLEDYAFFP